MVTGGVQLRLFQKFIIFQAGCGPWTSRSRLILLCDFGYEFLSWGGYYLCGVNEFLPPVVCHVLIVGPAIEVRVGGRQVSLFRLRL